MQHAGLQYGQGATHSHHQSPPFAHIADISTSNGGNLTSSLRQFRKKDGVEPSILTTPPSINQQASSTIPKQTDLSVANGGGGVGSGENIARVRPHNHYPAGPNDFYRYHHQYTDFASNFGKDAPTVKFSEIAETSPPSTHHYVDLTTQSTPKHHPKDKDFIDMCTIQQSHHHSKTQNFPENLTRQQSYPPPDLAHQYKQAESRQMHHHHPQYHPHYQQQYPYAKYQPSATKYPENDFLAKLQRINPSMARSIMNEHHHSMRDSTPPNAYQPSYQQQQQRYYHNNNYNNYLPQGYYQNNSTCSYRPPAAAAPARYPSGGERSLSPRRGAYVDYLPPPSQKISPNYPLHLHNAAQFEYAQHYQHRRNAAAPAGHHEYYQHQQCRTAYHHEAENAERAVVTAGGSSGGLRHFIENWAEEDVGTSGANAENFKEPIRMHSENSATLPPTAAGPAAAEPVYVINSADLPLENVALVTNENGQIFLKNNNNIESVVRVKDVEIVENEATSEKLENETKTVENSTSGTTSVIQEVPVSTLKDMPSLLDEEKAKNASVEDLGDKNSEHDAMQDESILASTEELVPKVRTQRIFSVDDIINNIGGVGSGGAVGEASKRRASLPLLGNETSTTSEKLPSEASNKGDEEEAGKKDEQEDVQYQNVISVEDDSVIVEIGGELVQLNLNVVNGTKVVSVLALSDNLVIDTSCQNGQNEKEDEEKVEIQQEEKVEEVEEVISDKPEELESNVEKPEEKEEICEEIEEIVLSEEDNLMEIEANEVVIGADEETNASCDLAFDFVPLESISAHENEESQATQQQEEESEVKCEEVEQSQELIPNNSDLIKVPSPSEESCQNPNPETEEVPHQIESKTEDLPDLAKTIEKSKEYKENKSELDEEIEIKQPEEDEIKQPEEPKLEVVKENQSKLLNEPYVRLTKIACELPISKIQLDVVKKVEKLAKSEPNKVQPEKALVPKSTNKKPIETRSKFEDSEKVVKTKKSSEIKSKSEKDCSSKSSGDIKPKAVQTKAETLKPDEKQIKKQTEETPKLRSKRKDSASEPKSLSKPKQNIPKSKDVDEKLKKSAQDSNNNTSESKQKKKLPIEKDRPIEKVTICTKAAKKLFEPNRKQQTKQVSPNSIKKQKLCKLEETVNKIKSLKKKSEDKNLAKTSKQQKKVTFSDSSPVFDKSNRRLSWEEYSSRKRKPLITSSSDDCSSSSSTTTSRKSSAPKIADNTVTSSNDDVISQVEQSIECAIKEKIVAPLPNIKISSPTTSTTTSSLLSKVTDWEDEEDEVKKEEVGVKKLEKNEEIPVKMTPIIDVNDFNIPPREELEDHTSPRKTEDDSLENYKNVVDSKLNSLNITIPTMKLKTIESQDCGGVSLIQRFLNKNSLDCNELEKVRQIIEIKRKIQFGAKCSTSASPTKYEVNTNQLKMQIRKMPNETRRRKQRFRNLYGDEESDSNSEHGGEGEAQGKGGGEARRDESESETSTTSDDDDEEEGGKMVGGDYSVYQQRDTQGVPKLIIKRKFGVGLPQPFVKLERSQAAELLAKKRKLY